MLGAQIFTPCAEVSDLRILPIAAKEKQLLQDSIKRLLHGAFILAACRQGAAERCERPLQDRISDRPRTHLNVDKRVLDRLHKRFRKLLEGGTGRENAREQWISLIPPGFSRPGARTMGRIEPRAQFLRNCALRVGPFDVGQKIVKMCGKSALAHERRLNPRPQKRSQPVPMGDRAASIVDGKNFIHRRRRMDPTRTVKITGRVSESACKLEPFQILVEAWREPCRHATTLQHRRPVTSCRHKVAKGFLHFSGLAVGREASDNVDGRSISACVRPLVIRLGGTLKVQTSRF